MRTIGLVIALVAGTVALAAAPAGAAATITAPVLGPIQAGVPISVTVAVADAGPDPVLLEVVVGFEAPETQTLVDDGLGDDAVAGDGIYSGSIPAQSAGQLVRYKVTVGASTWPVKDGKRTRAGFVVDRPAVATQLPVLDWYLSPADIQWLADNRGSNTYVPAVLVVGDEVIDGVEVRNQGGFSNRYSPKPHYKFKLPGSVTVSAPIFDQPVDEFVADADREDTTTTFGVIVNDLMEAAGQPTRMVSTARVERNGAFFGVYQLYEEFDGTWIDRLDFPLASMYKAENGQAHLVDDGDLALLQHRWEEEDGDGTYADLQELVTAIDREAGPARGAAIIDRFDLPLTIDALAMSSLLHLYDIVGNNLQLVHDGSTGRWRVFPNDLDRAMGWESFREGFAPFMMASGTIDLLRDPAIADAVLRRMRTLADTHFHGGIHDRAAAAVQLMADDLLLDRAAWPLGETTPAQGLAALADWLRDHRRIVDDWTAKGLMPGPQEASARAVVSEVRAAGDDGDFVELANPSTTTAVDLSGWRLEGAVDAQLPGGTAVAAGGRIVVPVDPRRMASRNEGVFVAGVLEGPLPLVGSVSLLDPEGAVRDAVAWTVGAGWPDPAGSGRSLEARSLGDGRGSGSGWSLSPEAGGTPGRAGASARGLEVTVTPHAQMAMGEGVETRVVVTNHGPGPATGIRLRGPSGGCDLDLTSLAAGASASRWCDVRTPLPDAVIFPMERLAATATSTEQPEGVTSSSIVLSVPVPTDIDLPRIEQIRLGPSRLDLDVDVGLSQVPEFKIWQVQAGLLPVGAGPASGTVLRQLPAGSVAVAPGQRVRADVTVRNDSGIHLTTKLTPPVTARPSARWPFTTDAALIDRWFRDLMGRAPTSGESTMWSLALGGGGHPADLVSWLLAQDRWERSVDPLARLYLAHFGRAADPSGLRYWTARRRAGVSLDRISAQFAGSSEFARRYQGLGTRAFVAAVYLNVFGRPSDPGGLDYWTRRVEGGMPRGSVVVQFSESAEGIRRKASTVDPLVAWFALHGTTPTEAWMAMARDWLDQGGDLGTVIESARSDDRYQLAIS